jgi:hypothetical protein
MVAPLSPRELWFGQELRGEGGALPDLPLDLPLSDLPWYELLVRLRPHAAAAGSTRRQQRVPQEIRDLLGELEGRVRELATKVPMGEVLKSDVDKERAIQDVVTHLLLPDIVERMREPARPQEEYVRARLRRATINIRREASRRHAKRRDP